MLAPSPGSVIAICAVSAGPTIKSFPARRGVAHPRRVLAAEDNMREEGRGDRTALIRPLTYEASTAFVMISSCPCNGARGRFATPRRGLAGRAPLLITTARGRGDHAPCASRSCGD